MRAILACGVALLALPILLPMSVAEPKDYLADLVAVDVATQDSEHHWTPHGFVCASVVTTHRYTLRFAGSEGDVLTLSAFDLGDSTFHSVEATPFEPATLEVLQGSPCGDFYVRGTSVADAAPYEVTG